MRHRNAYAADWHQYPFDGQLAPLRRNEAEHLSTKSVGNCADRHILLPRPRLADMWLSRLAERSMTVSRCAVDIVTIRPKQYVCAMLKLSIIFVVSVSLTGSAWWLLRQTGYEPSLGGIIVVGAVLGLLMLTALAAIRRRQRRQLEDMRDSALW